MQKIMIIEDDDMICLDIKKHLIKLNNDLCLLEDYEKIIQSFLDKQTDFATLF